MLQQSLRMSVWRPHFIRLRRTSAPKFDHSEELTALIFRIKRARYDLQ